ncbi:glycosyltransferase [Gallaecimonas pentaromativorans]|uniref:glycosyltransferase n=1 Tax=Gallaecimonas pentaromativorans TaxID=584787 RepID=UPI003A906C0B
MSELVVGIYCRGQGAALAASLRALWAGTDHGFTPLLLLDGPQPPLPSTWETLPRLSSLEVLGQGAFINAMKAAMPARVYGFIEAGTLVAPGCIDALLAALLAAPANGLAGPSSNRGWNEQAQLLDERLGLAEQAHSLAGEGQASQYLKPLYSLGGFCLLIKAEVLTHLGGVDEGYGAAPGWEMDTNIRAARLGWQGLWVKEALAIRAASSDTDAALLAGKRRYQKRFCGQWNMEEERLSCAHCLGDNCPHFAHQPMPGATLNASAPAFLPAKAMAAPLVSCVMPTKGRPAWLAQSVRYFLAQDHPNKELVIVFDQPADLGALACHPSVRLVASKDDTSIGAKRQLGNQHARGDFIVQWDDDDWYSSRRLSRQLWPLHLGLADVTALTQTGFFDVDASQCWQVTPCLYRQLFHGAVAGGTLAYRRSLWQQAPGYPPASLGEDARFLKHLEQRGAELLAIGAGEDFLYLRHGLNSWRFVPGYLDAKAWSLRPLPRRFAADKAFYKAMKQRPLLSCIMPTANRPGFAKEAINAFLAQDYPHKELVIVDDGHDDLRHLVPPHPAIRYHRIAPGLSLGAKRNRCCELASGHIIAHWDDDDWRAPDWLSRQVALLEKSGADLCGLAALFFAEPATGRCWQYRYDGEPPWAAGGTLCYWRRYWLAHPFSDRQIGEDNAFVWEPGCKLALSDYELGYIATVHGANTSPKATDGARWHPCSEAQRRQLWALMGAQEAGAADKATAEMAGKLSSHEWGE